MPRTARARLASTSVAAMITVLPLGLSTAAADDSVAIETTSSSQTIAGAKVIRTTDPNTPENVTFVLKMRGATGLEKQVEHGMKNFLTVDAFARRHGQQEHRIRALTTYLESYGLKTTTYANKMAVNAKGTAEQFNEALRISQVDVKVPGHRGRPAVVAHSPKGVPVLPGHLGDMVTAVLGLDNYATFTSQSSSANPQVMQASVAGGGSCPVTGVWAQACRLPSDFGHQYGLDPLYASGLDGRGQTIGIVTLASLDVGAPEKFWKDHAGIKDTGRKVTVRDVDGGPGPASHVSGSGETDLDVQQAGGVAPGADIVVYQAPNNDAGWVDAFMTAASDNVASSVSASWGYSETIARIGMSSGRRSPALLDVYDQVFLEMAAQGQSTFLPTGDHGAYMATGDVGSTDISVAAPASSPYVTAVGGTSLPWKNTFTAADGSNLTVGIERERAWGWNYMWSPIQKVSGSPLRTVMASTMQGGGGGYSAVSERPAYQQRVPGISAFSAVPVLSGTSPRTFSGITVPTGFEPITNAQVVHGSATGRVVPDLAANADPYSGYLMYEPSASAIGGPALQDAGGGTSFVAPQLGGTSALYSQKLGRRVGLWNPWIYRAALGEDSPFTPLDEQGPQNSNLHYTGTPGKKYNPAVGLGIPDLGKLSDSFR
ncbi:MAG: S53 family serine peptidase [Luteococcus sp.]|uniref:S53 family peptidase n=1 Tax=Luteococcus sp. TaxID=1969402 RepID=UPI0026474CF2|nr:S53 family serine peptidase [Luteococcus sp.]MDN5562251.1 S53 family serine peptidase [Luteococcus sp.]